MHQEQARDEVDSTTLGTFTAKSCSETLDRAGVRLTPRRDDSGEIVAVAVRDRHGQILLELSPTELCALISRPDVEIELWIRAVLAGPKHIERPVT